MINDKPQSTLSCHLMVVFQEQYSRRMPLRLVRATIRLDLFASEQE